MDKNKIAHSRQRQLGLKSESNGANLGFEAKLWRMCDQLRVHMNPTDYKYVVLGLIFLKYLSDSFYIQYRKFELCSRNEGIDPQDRYAYVSRGVPWVPKEARWDIMEKNIDNPDPGQLIDAAMDSIEEANSSLKDMLPKGFSQQRLDQHKLAELVHTIGQIGLDDAGSQSLDILGRVYEYFLGRFASAEGNGGGEFYTPQCVVKLLVNMIEPFKGKVYDPCCGSGGMFIQSARFVKEHGGRVGNIKIYGQESNPSTWKLAKMNLALRGINADLGPNYADSFTNDLHPKLKADFILANPPFNMSEWGGDRLQNDPRWLHGVPPPANANFAWIQHFIHHLSPKGKAGFVLANGSLSSNQQQDALIRRSLIENDLVDCIVYLPTQLFYTTQISVSLWFIVGSKSIPSERNRTGQTLFIYAYDFGQLTDRTHRELSEEEINKIAEVYRSWRGKSPQKYRNKPGFSRSCSIKEIKSHRYALVPGRYVGFNRKHLIPPDISILENDLADIRSRLKAVQTISKHKLRVVEEFLNG